MPSPPLPKWGWHNTLAPPYLGRDAPAPLAKMGLAQYPVEVGGVLAPLAKGGKAQRGFEAPGGFTASTIDWQLKNRAICFSANSTVFLYTNCDGCRKNCL